MKNINWEQVAQQYQLSPTEIQEQVLIGAAIMGSMILDSNKKADTFKFTCEEPSGLIELTIKRL